MQAEYEALGEVGSASEMEFDAEEEEGGEDDLQRREVQHMVHVKMVQCVRVVVLATQIEDYIRTIGLGSKSNAKSAEDRKTKEKVDNKHLKENGTAEATKKENKKDKKEKKKKKRNAVEEGQEDRTLERQKKKKNKKKGGSTVTKNGEGERGVGERAEVERQLLSLSASTHTRLLVSPNSEQPWFDQVSPSFHCIRLCVCVRMKEFFSCTQSVCMCVSE